MSDEKSQPEVTPVKSKNGPGNADSQPAKGAREAKSFPRLYRQDVLDQVNNAIRAVYEKQGRNTVQADALFLRLTANLRVLKQLHALSKAVLSGDQFAPLEFRARVQDMVHRYPQFRGSTERLLSRANRSPQNKYFSHPLKSMRHATSYAGLDGGGTTNKAIGARAARIPGRPCGAVTPDGMMPIYVSVFATHAHDQDELSGALDVVTGLSLAHGRFEALSGAYAHDGLGGVGRMLEWGESTGDPAYQVPGDKGVPGSGGKKLGDPKDITVPTGGFDGDGHFRMPGDDMVPQLDDCEQLRTTCEALLVDALTNGTADLPTSGRPGPPAAWADNIDSIEFPGGRCAGDTMIIHGHDFGNPSEVALVMMVRGECSEVPVFMRQGVETRPHLDTTLGPWTQTKITVKLPEGVTSGPVGFYNPLAKELYNGWSTQANRGVHEVLVASRCAGEPITSSASGQAVEIFTPFQGVPCPPVGDHNVIQVGAPVILKFEASTTALSGKDVLADPDDEITLSWEVVNADHITLTRLFPSGPDFDGSSAVNDPPGSVFHLGKAGHSKPMEFAYELTASNGNRCNSVNDIVRVHASKRPGLAIDSIEVTHGIQTLSNDVKLIKNKPTVVRVYASHKLNGFGGSNVLPNVIGRLRLRREGEAEWSDWLNPINAATSSSLPNSINLTNPVTRSLVNDTLNFSLPTNLCDGTQSIEVELSVQDFAVPPAWPSGFSETVSRQFGGFKFNSRRQPAIKFLPVTVVPDPNGVVSIASGISNPPTNPQCTTYLTAALNYLPTTAASISRLVGYSVTLRVDSITITPPGGPSLTRSISYDIGGETLLALMEVLHDLDGDEALWAALVPVSGLGLWGQASRIGGKTCIVLMGFDGSPQNSEAHGAHELSHCLNQKHINSCGAKGGDKPSDWGENNGTIADVPFDITRNSTLTGASELMTYCSPRWTSPKRWQQIFDELGE